MSALLSPRVEKGALVETIRQIVNEYTISHPNPTNELTKREHEIIHLVSEGLTNREIARRLEVSIDTVKTHIHHIMHKLGVKDRVQAVAVAYHNGWLQTHCKLHNLMLIFIVVNTKEREGKLLWGQSSS